MTDTWQPAHDETAGAPDARLRASDSDATRYLCAAAYLDEDFSRLVLDEVLHQPHRAVAPSYGIDLGPIIRHCLEARRRAFVRDVWVTATLVGMVALGGISAALTVLGAWSIVIGVRLVRRRAYVKALLLVVLGVPFLAVLGPLSFLQQDQPSSAFDTESGSSGAGWAAVWLLVGVVLLWGANFWHLVGTHTTITEDLAASAFSGAEAPPVGPAHESRLAYVEQAQRGNVTVYSRGWSRRPFVGAGRVASEWTLVTPLRAAPGPLEIDLLSGQPGRTAQPSTSTRAAPALDIQDLYERTRDGFVALGHPALPVHERLHGLSVQDRVFVAGLLPPGSPHLDRQRRPVYRMSSHDVEAVDRAERGQVRHYQALRMAAWRGEMEVTVFLYAAVRGGMLFVEFVATELPSLHPRYHEIDAYQRMSPGCALGLAARAVPGVLLALDAPIGLGTRAVDALRRTFDPAADRREITRRLAFDYGARDSVRELGTQFSQSAKFQDYDAAERILLVKRRALEVIVDTMRELGFDVSDLAQQASTIINNGTLVGSVTGSSIAVGQGAAVSTVMTAPARGARAQAPAN